MSTGTNSRAGESSGSDKPGRDQTRSQESRDATQPEDSDTSYRGGSADDDTSAGYGVGGATGNSSGSDTGLGEGLSNDTPSRNSSN